ncbi:hypothetical protein [Sphingosinithalassobacter sp. CS137]|uniref:hypothetical protein n=1 Tax=Sphingosinithalassobacter sp. CS137 TaxID=2762748 RepID=UPI00165D5617|nr:hypothetical protein [Sphingosinithalassobacter sp. CS137]
MPIHELTNSNAHSLFLTIEPSGAEFEVPSLATIAVRSSALDGRRVSCSLTDTRIDLFCDAAFEIDLVLPRAFDRLLWDPCVEHGCCGSICEESGAPLHVEKLLPATGSVTAESFAALALRAEQWPGPADPRYPVHLARLAALFERHMGAAEVSASQLARNCRRPFEDA